jgi:hypothetical protein
MFSPVEYWQTDGDYARCRSTINRAIGQYARRSRFIYIGQTQQKPEERFRQHQMQWARGHKWHRMIVIYQARDYIELQVAENDLIDYAMLRMLEGQYRCMVLNDGPSQPPAMKENPHGYWIYILVQS